MRMSPKKLEILQSRSETMIELFSNSKKIEQEKKHAIVEILKVIKNLLSIL